MRSCFSYFLYVFFTCVVIVVFVTNEIKKKKINKKKKKIKKKKTPAGDEICHAGLNSPIVSLHYLLTYYLDYFSVVS